MTLTKDTLLAIFKQQLGLQTNEARDYLELLLDEIKSNLESGDSVKIANFGKWTVKSKRDRQGRNPNTGLPMAISARKVVTFHPSEKLRKEVNPGEDLH